MLLTNKHFRGKELSVFLNCHVSCSYSCGESSHHLVYCVHPYFLQVTCSFFQNIPFQKHQSKKRPSGLSDHKPRAFYIFTSLRSHSLLTAFLCFTFINIYRHDLQGYIKILLTLKQTCKALPQASFKILFHQSLIIYIIVLLKATLRLSCLLRYFFNVML